LPTLLSNFFNVLQSFRYAVVLVALGITALLIILASSVEVDYSFEAFFPKWDPNRAVFDDYRNRFPKEDAQFALFWIEGEPPDLELYQNLEEVALIFEEAGLTSVEWFGSVDVARQQPIDGELALVIGPLVGDGLETTDEITSLLERYRSDPLYEGVVWNDDLSVFVVHGFIERLRNNDTGRRDIEQQIAADLERFENGERTLILTGLPVIRARALELLSIDQAKLLGGGTAIAFLVLFLVFRSIRQTFLCLASIVPSYLFAVALMAAFDRPITVMTSIMPTIVLVVLLSDTVHLVLQYRLRLADGMSHRDAVSTSFSELFAPCFVTSLTTALGFLSLVSTKIDVMVDLGLFTATAILVGFALNMLLLPALLSFGGSRATGRQASPSLFPLSLLIDLAQRSLKLPLRPIILIFAGLGVVCVTLASQLEINTRMFDDVMDGHPLKREVQTVERNGFGLFSVNVYLTRQGEMQMYHPEVLHWMRDLQTFAEQHDLVTKTFAVTDQLMQIRQAIMDGLPSEYRLPQTPGEAAQYLIIAELSDADYIDDVFLGDEGRAQIIISIQDRGSAEVGPFIDSLEAYIDANPPPAGITAEVTGLVKMAQTVFSRMIGSLFSSLLIAVVSITVVLATMFRSVWLGILSLLPNIFPLLLVGAAMAIGGFDIKPTTVLVFAVAFGIVVDDTIHMLSRVRSLLSAGLDTEAALETALKESGSAIVISSVVIGLGFSLLMISNFEVLFLVGFLTLVAIAGALISDLFFLPALIRAAFAKRATQ